MSDLYLVHHGIKGQKWGVRRYQNEDGSYTDAGKRRYGISGNLSYDNKGRMIDSSTGKRISKKQKKLFNNSILANEKKRKEVEEINKKYSDSERNVLEKKYALDRAKDSYYSHYNDAYNGGNTISGISSGLKARNDKKMIKYLQQDLKDAEDDYKKVQKEVDDYILNYVNKRIKDFSK